MPKDIIDAAVLHNICSKVTPWIGNRPRVLVLNQIILASIWYLASCSHIDGSVFQKIQAIIRSFVWSGSPDGNLRAKVAWDTSVIPTIKGGLKIFDPYAQARALLAKMIPRAMSQGPQPWKTLIRHRISRLQFRKDEDWDMSELWLCTATRVKPEGSKL